MERKRRSAIAAQDDRRDAIYALTVLTGILAPRTTSSAGNSGAAHQQGIAFCCTPHSPRLINPERSRKKCRWAAGARLRHYHLFQHRKSPTDPCRLEGAKRRGASASFVRARAARTVHPHSLRLSAGSAVQHLWRGSNHSAAKHVPALPGLPVLESALLALHIGRSDPFFGRSLGAQRYLYSHGIC